MVTMNDPELARRVKAVAAREPGKNLKWLVKRLAKTGFEATVTHPLVFNLGVYPALRMAQSRTASQDRFASGYHSDEVTMAGRLGRYTNYQARLGLAQMETVKGLLDKRVHNARRLIDRLKPGVHFQTNNRPGVESNFMLVTALFPRMEEVAAELLRRGVDTKRHYMRDCSRLLEGEQDFPLAVRAENEILHLPAYPTLGDSQIDRVAAAVEEVVHQIGLGQG
jgi:dTDP-4-amino-4,6-dideoxygalactose transaminase